MAATATQCHLCTDHTGNLELSLSSLLISPPSNASSSLSEEPSSLQTPLYRCSTESSSRFHSFLPNCCSRLPASVLSPVVSLAAVTGMFLKHQSDHVTPCLRHLDRCAPRTEGQLPVTAKKAFHDWAQSRLFQLLSQLHSPASFHSHPHFEALKMFFPLCLLCISAWM